VGRRPELVGKMGTKDDSTSDLRCCGPRSRAR
jgi:hypothetical protein